MPKCEICGFAHAQPDRCINCGAPDPFRRHRIIKFSALVAFLVLAIVAAVFFYQRYSQIERSVRQAESAARHQDVLAVPPAPVEP